MDNDPPRPYYDPSILRRKRETECLMDLEQKVVAIIAGVPSGCLVLGKTIIIGNDGKPIEYRKKR